MIPRLFRSIHISLALSAQNPPRSDATTRPHAFASIQFVRPLTRTEMVALSLTILTRPRAFVPPLFALCPPPTCCVLEHQPQTCSLSEVCCEIYSLYSDKVLTDRSDDIARRSGDAFSPRVHRDEKS